jgi:hypothetical protein
LRILHTPEEAHEVIADKERKQKDDERWRQFSIEDALKRDLLSRHKKHTWMEQRDKERLKRLPKLEPKRRQDAEKEARETDRLKRVHRKAIAIARSFGREYPKFGDFCEASRIPNKR